ncbi:glycosyltransferase [Bradyrhizobium sp. 62]|uniref:glycosyltransferase n=1 Tax=Bradyrhizobium sp. 62 TaxID=1043588 RepID=UPI001FF93FBB|nr:glycosyltransferase [Bradyrhizobium sp. 62]MCK1368319.1 glycosyltransferase [Bradyrhizobium sp. 62]
MKIVYVSYLHPSVAPGGAQQVAFEMFQASLSQGHDAYLIAALEANHDQIYGKPGAPIVPMQGEERQYFYFPQHYDFLHLSVGDWRSIHFFRDLIERLAPDVIHFHHYHRVGVESIRAARLAAPNAVISFTFHEMMAICMADGQMVKKGTRELCHAASPIACNKCFPDLRPEFVTLRKSRLLAALAECDSFIFPSEFIANRYVDWGLSPEKCVVIPNGQANLGGAFDRSQHSPQVNRFGFFGQFIDNKGVDVILEALLILGREQRVPASGIVVEINGGNKHYASPSYMEKISLQVEELRKLQSRIVVRENGAYGRDQLEGRMSSIDWVIVPSTWWEIFGLVVSEGWMFGRPVIASAIAGLKERVVPDGNGFTFPARDSRALADLLVTLVSDEGRWKRVNSSIEQPWSEVDMLDAHIDIWKELVSQRATARPSRSIEPPAMRGRARKKAERMNVVSDRKTATVVS